MALQGADCDPLSNPLRIAPNHERDATMNMDTGAGPNPGTVDEKIEMLMKSIRSEHVPVRMLHLARRLQEAIDARKDDVR
jgi:hypothetical protein